MCVKRGKVKNVSFFPKNDGLETDDGKGCRKYKIIYRKKKEFGFANVMLKMMVEY